MVLCDHGERGREPDETVRHCNSSSKVRTSGPQEYTVDSIEAPGSEMVRRMGPSPARQAALDKITAELAASPGPPGLHGHSALLTPRSLTSVRKLSP
jgi:hypothetical protein